MERSRPAITTLVAILQFIPVFILPPSALLSVSPILLLAPVALFVFLGWAMLVLKRWALTLCTFVQGLNVIVRFLILFPQTMRGGSVDWLFVVTSLISIALSSAILYVTNKPHVQVAFKA